ncbi:acyl-CoA dehydrogenase family protein [Salinirarus marinus]|uniref:acyl-CoA dehydrogenase family protein n=1 Tax=Salinirarus marinus TaxID=3068310 RepID=UPI003C6C775B
MTLAGVNSGLTEDQRALREDLRAFAAEEIRPHAAAADREESFPEPVWDALADRDLTALTVPERYGGLDVDRTTYSLVNEEVAYGQLAVASALSVHSLVTSCIAEFGTETQRERWLPPMAEGRPVGMFALSEPGAGSNPAEMETVARREGDEYVVDGQKQWITNGQRGEVCILFAKTDPDDPSSVTQFLVPKSAGIEVGKKESKLGLRASDTTALLFDGVRIPADSRLTEEGRGLSAAFHVLTGGRIGIAAQALGLAQAAYDETRAYVTGRDDGRPADRQAVRHAVAEMGTSITAARLLVREAARQDDADADPRLVAAMAKYVASETAVDVTNRALSLLGHRGYTDRSDAERLFRDAKITTIYEGTSEIQKTIVARGLLD